jgi:hypothetical protein
MIIAVIRRSTSIKAIARENNRERDTLSGWELFICPGQNMRL